MRNIKKYTKSLEEAVKLELSRPYSFGCVTYKSNGSHDDMDYKTFEKSTLSITDSLNNLNWDKISNFYDLKDAGRKVENKMFEATNGINTQKGLIFLHMFLALSFVKGIKWDNISKYIKNLSVPLVSDYKKNAKAIKWDKNNLKDIRFYPLDGFDEILKLCEYSINNKLSDTNLSLHIIAMVDDTTTAHRSSIDTLRIVQNKAKNILSEKNEGIRQRLIKELNTFYLENKLSSGGVADLFTTTRTLEYLKEDFDE